MEKNGVQRWGVLEADELVEDGDVLVAGQHLAQAVDDKVAKLKVLRTIHPGPLLRRCNFRRFSGEFHDFVLHPT